MKLKRIRCKNCDKLVFDPGDKAFTIGQRGEIHEIVIRWINARFGKDKRGIVAFPTSYEGSLSNKFKDNIFDCTYELNELYKTKKLAEKDAKFISISFSGDDWYQSIGIREGVDRLKYNEDCDLGPCCSIISDIRDLLERCRQNEGLIVREKKRLQQLLNKHEPVTEPEKLFDILDAIGVKWKES